MHLIDKYFFKERRDALRIRIWKIILKNRTSYPYLSGDAFAELCDYAAYGKDGSKGINVSKLRRAKRLFVPSHRLDELLTNHFENISATVLICGNSDRNFTADPLLPKSVKLWLCQNYAVENGFGFTLPIGLENLRLGKSGFKGLHKPTTVEKVEDKILVPPMLVTNPLRSHAIAKCKSFSDIFEVYSDYLDPKEYFKLIGRYLYVLVLEGNGFDTHRLWEVLYQGGIPVMFSTSWSRNLQSLGVQVILIDSLELAQEEIILDSRNLRETPVQQEIMKMNYWSDFIANY